MPSFARSLTRIAILSAAVAAPWLSVSMTLAECNPNTGTVVQGEVRIEYFAQGTEPVVVLLPSLGRGAEDFDSLAKRIAQAGLAVAAPCTLFNGPAGYSAFESAYPWQSLLNTVGGSSLSGIQTINSQYGQPYIYQISRNIRFAVKFTF